MPPQVVSGYHGRSSLVTIAYHTILFCRRLFQDSESRAGHYRCPLHFGGEHMPGHGCREGFGVARPSVSRSGLLGIYGGRTALAVKLLSLSALLRRGKGAA
jgi:hypothetical protein